jgi:hypothetical protein
MSERDGGPAFPTRVPREQMTEFGYQTVYDSEDGMSLRDWFAGQVVAGVVTQEHITHGFSPAGVACVAYEIADAMLKERAK